MVIKHISLGKDGDYLRFRGEDDNTILFELRNNTSGSNACSFPNGKLGIGTSDPSSELHVMGSCILESALCKLSVTGTNNTHGIEVSSIDVSCPGARKRGYFLKSTNSDIQWFFGHLYNGGNDTTDLVWEYNNSVKAILDKDGNFGIGTTSPSGKLEVIGDISCDSITIGNITNTELEHLNGVTSNIQSQLDSKQSRIDTSNRINSDFIHDGSVSNTEFGYLNGVTSDIQTQLDSKQNILVAGIGITIDGDTINSTASGGGVDINENTDISLNDIKVHGDLSGINANFDVLSTKKLKLNNIEFNESFKTEETRIINVTAAGGKFYFDGVVNPKLYLVPGITYRFNQGDSTNSIHPLRFATIDNINNTYRYSKNVTVNGTQGQAGSYTEIQVTQENKDKFFYVCTSHSGMGNEVYVLNSRNIKDLSAVDASFNGVTGVNGYFTTLNSNNITVGGFTLANSNFNLGGKNIISASRQGSLTDLELKNNGNTGFLASGETGDVSMTGTLEVDVINEKTSASGVIIEGVTIKNKSITAGTHGTISATNFNVGSVNIISAIDKQVYVI